MVMFKKCISLLLVCLVITSFFMIVPVSTRASSYRDDFIDTLLENESDWNTPSFGDGSSLTTQVSFLDINFDGNLELVTNYMTGSGGPCVEVYGYRDDEVIHYNVDKGANLVDAFNYYYDQKSNVYRIFGTDTTKFCYDNTISHKDMSNYELVVIGDTIYKDFYTSSCPINGYYRLDRKAHVIEGYIEGSYNYNVIGPYNEKSYYDELNSKRLNDCLFVEVKRIFIGYTDWKTYSASQKRQALEKAYDGFTYDDYSESEGNDEYIKQHVDFVSSTRYQSLVTHSSFYYNIMKNEDDSAAVAYGVWEYLGDIGEITSLKFDDLMICDNPYDLILSDLFTQYATLENFSSATKIEILESANTCYDSLVKILKSKKEWDDSYNKKLELEIKGIVFKPDYKVKDTHAYEVIENLLHGIVDDKKLESIFVGLNKVDTLYEYIGNATDIVDNFVKAYNAYVAAVGYIEAKDKILSSLLVSAYEMDPICGALFIDSLSDYLGIENKDDAFNYALNDLLGESAWTAYDVIGKKLVQQGICKFVEKTAAGSIGILTFTYNTTYKVMDFITANGSKSELYKIMYAASRLEEAILSHTKGLAESMNNSPNVDNVMLFDATWGLLQNIESYSYQILAQYAAKSSISTRFIKFFNKDYVSEDMASPLYLSSLWKESNCHDGEYNTSHKIVSVKCPTDVAVYADGKQKLCISNNKIISCGLDIDAMVVGDQKFIALPANSEYDIKILATDDGKMNYNISEFSSMELNRYIEYENISLVSNSVFYGTINDELYTEEKNYRLETDTQDIECSFDSMKDNLSCIGDTDSDGEVSIMDATAIQLHIAQISSLSTHQINNADTDGDGEVSIMDATEIQLFVAKLIPALGEREFITLCSTQLTMNVGDKKTLTATVKPSSLSNATVTWSSSNSSIVNVLNGVVEAKGLGTATITAKTKSGVTAECTITVKDKAVEVSSIKLNSNGISLNEGNTYQLVATVLPENATNKTLTWSTNNPSVATVSSSGKITAVSIGKATITAKASNGVIITCAVSVVPIQVSSITLSDTNEVLYLGFTHFLTATLKPDNANDKSLTWSSSDTSVVTVSSSGSVTAKGLGTATVTARATNGVSASCVFTVCDILPDSLMVSKNTQELDVGQSFQLTGTITPSYATNKTITWSSSDTSVATVTQRGNVKAVGSGKATITAKTVNGIKAVCEITSYTPVSGTYELFLKLRKNPAGCYRLTADDTLNTLDLNIDTFTGCINGDGHTITIAYDSTSKNVTNNCYKALLPKTNGAIIKNLNISGTIDHEMYSEGSYSNYCAGFVAYAENTTFVNCTNEAMVKSTIWSNYSGYGYVGGITAWSNNCSFTDCTNKGGLQATTMPVKVASSIAGGISGQSSGCKFDSCSNSGNVYAHSSNSSDTYYSISYSGGIVGSSNSSELKMCVTSGNMMAYAWPDYETYYTSVAASGGIIAYGNGKIENCSSSCKLNPSATNGGVIYKGDSIAYKN